MITAPSRAVGLAARATLVLSCAFLSLLALLHLLTPEFDPSWRMVSEYAIGPYGWLMTLAFLCWAGSVAGVLIGLWPVLHTTVGRIGRWWLAAVAAALAGAALWKTNAITDPTPRTANELHRLCGAIVILTFPIAASLVLRGLRRAPGWAGARRRLVLGTALVWLGQVGFFASIALSRAAHPGAGRVGPHILLGWPNRVMVVCYHLWLLLIATWLARGAGRPTRG